MKIVSLRAGVNASGHLVLSVDVSKKHLDCYVRLTDSYGRIFNTSPAVRTHLIELFRLSRREDLAGILVACEPSGGYERTLLETARSLGVEGHDYSSVRATSIPHPGVTSIPRVGP